MLVSFESWPHHKKSSSLSTAINVAVCSYTLSFSNMSLIFNVNIDNYLTYSLNLSVCLSSRNFYFTMYSDEEFFIEVFP